MFSGWQDLVDDVQHPVRLYRLGDPGIDASFAGCFSRLAAWVIADDNERHIGLPCVHEAVELDDLQAIFMSPQDLRNLSTDIFQRPI